MAPSLCLPAVFLMYSRHSCMRGGAPGREAGATTERCCGWLATVLEAPGCVSRPRWRRLCEFGLNTSRSSQQPLRRAVGRSDVRRPLALRVPEAAVGPVVQQERHHLGVRQAGGDVQRRGPGHPAVHCGSWRRAEAGDVRSIVYIQDHGPLYHIMSHKHFYFNATLELICEYFTVWCYCFYSSRDLGCDRILIFSMHMHCFNIIPTGRSLFNMEDEHVHRRGATSNPRRSHFSPSWSSFLTELRCWCEQATWRGNPDGAMNWSTSAPCWTRGWMHSEWPSAGEHKDTFSLKKMILDVLSQKHESYMVLKKELSYP